MCNFESVMKGLDDGGDLKGSFESFKLCNTKKRLPAEFWRMNVRTPSFQFQLLLSLFFS
jgi:hypothetical protein